MLDGLKRMVGLGDHRAEAEEIARYRTEATPAQKLGVAAADTLARSDDTTVRRTVPDIWKQGPIPRDADGRWLAIARAAHDAASRHLVHGPSHGLPTEIAIAARLKSIEVAARHVVPGTPVASTIERDHDRVAHHTRMSLAIGDPVGRSLDHQAEMLARDVATAHARFKEVGALRGGVPPEDFDQRRVWMRQSLEMETAMARSGRLEPHRVVETAIHPVAVASRLDTREFDTLPHARPDHRASIGRGREAMIADMREAMPGRESTRYHSGPHVETRGPATQREYDRREMEADTRVDPRAPSPKTRAMIEAQCQAAKQFAGRT